MPAKTPRIAVVIPAFKTEKSISLVIDQIPDMVNLIVVVNDNSPDDLVKVVLGCDDPRVQLISNKHNLGVGGATMVGYAYALEKGAEFVVKVDSDDQMDLVYFNDLVNPLIDKQADYAKGNRFLHQDELRRMPVIRKLGNLGLSFFTKVATGYWHIFDPTNGYTAISNHALSLIEPKKVSNDYFFETSMLAELRKIEAVVIDIPIPAKYNEYGSSLKVSREFFLFLGKLTKRIVSRISNQYFKFDFSAVSFFLLSSLVLGLFGLTWGIVKWLKSYNTGIPATTGTVLIAVLPIILSVQFFIQAAALDINNIPRNPLGARQFVFKGKEPALITFFRNQIDSGEIVVHAR